MGAWLTVVYASPKNVNQHIDDKLASRGESAVMELLSSMCPMGDFPSNGRMWHSTSFLRVWDKSTMPFIVEVCHTMVFLPVHALAFSKVPLQSRFSRLQNCMRKQLEVDIFAHYVFSRFSLFHRKASFTECSNPVLHSL